MKLKVNGKPHDVDAQVPEETPLLWVLREELGLTGTKFGCGVAQCGACTIHIDGKARRSCVTPLRVAKDKEITTIEGISDGDAIHPLQQAWIDENVPQCGYCQSGQIMSALALIQARAGNVSDEDIDRVMSANLCRCGTYPRIRRAIHRALKTLAGGTP